MPYNYITTTGNILHPLTARCPIFLMRVRSCSLGWHWHGDSKSPSLESMDPQESYPLLSHQVVCVNLFEVSILHPTIFLQPSYSFLKEALGGSKLHHISSCLSRDGVQVFPHWRQSYSLALILLAPLSSALGWKRKSSSILPTKSTTQNSHGAHFPRTPSLPSFTSLNLRKEKTGWS